MKKLKILVITWYYTPQVGGVETVSKIIAEAFVKSGHDITILTSSEKNKTENFNGYKAVRTPLFFNKVEKFKKYFSEFLNDNDFDIVHGHNLSHTFNPGVSMAIVRECNKRNIPIIEHSHNAQLKTPEKTRKIIHSNFSKIICVSDFVRKRFVSLGVPKKKLITVHNPFDEGLFNPKNISHKDVLKMRKKIGVNDEVVVFFPARVVRMSKLEIGEQKQFKTLVSALSILKKEGIRFKLVFPGMKNLPNASANHIRGGKKLIEKYIRDKDLSDNVFVFENGLQLSDMPLAYAASDIVCMPSLNETFGMIFLEGSAMGKPIVAARSGAAPYIVKNGKTGIIVPGKNVKKLAKALKNLALKKGKRLSMGIAGRRMATKKFSSKKTFEKIGRIYASCVNNNK
jgi:glycosyltransferase involved in cell wall biosynthesis